jgi:glucosamine-6-phosphate deaminase
LAASSRTCLESYQLMDSLRQVAPCCAPNITILPSAEEASRAVADRLIALVNAKPGCRLGLATGQTPRRVYARMVEAVRAGQVSFDSVETINLDEYSGLSCDHPDSFAAYMYRELFTPAGFNPGKVNLIDGAAVDDITEAARYADVVRSRPADCQLLGIGTNGHIGFNEPGSTATSRVRRVELSGETLAANQPTLIDLAEVPRYAITMGIADILDAHEIVILATGAAKAKAVYRSLREVSTDDCPASHLKTHHNVHWIFDQAAAELL